MTNTAISCSTGGAERILHLQQRRLNSTIKRKRRLDFRRRNHTYYFHESLFAQTSTTVAAARPEIRIHVEACYTQHWSPIIERAPTNRPQQRIMTDQVSYRIGETTLTFDNSDGIVVEENGTSNGGGKLTINFTNFTGKCAASLDTAFQDDVFSHSTHREEKKSSEDYDTSTVTTAPIIMRDSREGSMSTVKLLSASASVQDESSSAKFVRPLGKWKLETEKQYGTQLLQRERINFFNDAKGSIRPRSRHLSDNLNDDVSLGSAASSITTSINSAGSASLFSSNTKARKTAFQPLKAERDMCINCCFCKAPFHKITRKRYVRTF